MLDHFSNLTYVHLMRIKIQEENLDRWRKEFGSRGGGEGGEEELDSGSDG